MEKVLYTRIFEFFNTVIVNGKGIGSLWNSRWQMKYPNGTEYNIAGTICWDPLDEGLKDKIPEVFDLLVETDVENGGFAERLFKDVRITGEIQENSTKITAVLCRECTPWRIQKIEGE